MVDWGTTVAALPFDDAGGGVKRSSRASPPGRATISNRKFLVASYHHRI